MALVTVDSKYLCTMCEGRIRALNEDGTLDDMCEYCRAAFDAEMQADEDYRLLVGVVTEDVDALLSALATVSETNEPFYSDLVMALARLLALPQHENGAKAAEDGARAAGLLAPISTETAPGADWRVG